MGPKSEYSAWIFKIWKSPKKKNEGVSIWYFLYFKSENIFFIFAGAERQFNFQSFKG